MSSQSPPAGISIHMSSKGRDSSHSSVHLLPCKLHCSCESQDNADENECSHSARVDEYFAPVIREVEGEERGALGGRCTASFRGRPLQGVLLAVPDGYTGALLQEKATKGNNVDEVRL